MSDVQVISALFVCGLAVMTVNSGKNHVTMELKVNFLEQLIDGPSTCWAGS